MNLTALRAEFVARGYDYVDSGGTTRQDSFINRGYHRICEEADWPFLQIVASGTAPLSSLTDIREVIYVLDTTNNAELQGSTANDIAYLDPNVSTAGTPQYWWLDQDTIKVYPTSASASLSVRYVKVPTDLSSGSDTPVLPTRYHPLIVDAAVLEAAKDADDLNTLQVLQADYDRRIQEMKRTLLNRNHQGPDYIRPVNSGWLMTY